MRRACIEPGCPRYAAKGKSRCLKHHREFERARWERGATGRRGSRPGWRPLRARVLREQGGKCPCGATATDVHHKDGNAKNDERSNLIGLCGPCHKEADAALRRARRARPDDD